jgi:ABC-2 type transport system permease protein
VGRDRPARDGIIDRVRRLAVLAGAGFRRYLRYRGAMVGGAVTNSVFGLLRASILTAAVASAGGSLGGYAASTAATFAWLTQALIAPLELFGNVELALRVRTGDIAVDLARPVDLQLQYAAADLGRAAAVTVPRGAPPLLIGALTFGLSMPVGWTPYLAGAVSVLLGLGISFGCRFLLNLTAFWLLDIRGALTFYVAVSGLFCGLYLPVSWFPGWVGAIAAATPFPSMVQAPADILSGRIGPDGVPGLLTRQLAWLVAVVLAGRAVQRLGTRTLVVQGG